MHGEESRMWILSALPSQFSGVKASYRVCEFCVAVSPSTRPMIWIAGSPLVLPRKLARQIIKGGAVGMLIINQLPGAFSEINARLPQ